MHTPEYTARIKNLIAAKDATEYEMKTALFHFRNGRKVSPETLESMRASFSRVLAVIEGTEEEIETAAHDARLEAWRKEHYGEDGA